MADLLQGLSEDDLYAVLPSTLEEQIRNLEKQNMPWDQIGTLLSNAPAVGLSTKSGSRWAGTLWVGVKTEFQSFLCTESATYADLRKDWDGHIKKGSNLALAALSGVIGAKLGVAGGVVAPLVIWVALVALRIGKQALCGALVAGAGSQNPPPAA